ncbi:MULTISPECIES: glycosyltransferase [Metabacillus]|uniref:Glycosyltransferase n=1 Tax=Metabacillus hrfriensis TaxID=3048891 RepID=A0ACD4RFH5_9BACI|nr:MULTISPECIES: glycosyltransferase [Metabacillus]UAL53364.1 glycosyltransferase [Metabacillus dongyingensis]WHZ58930.1 glycosyltransferase [Metabacillus sp. CT-WN-B3]
METIAHYLMEDVKINQRFIYNQMVYQGQYRTIVIGPFQRKQDTDFPLDSFYNINEIPDLNAFFKEQRVAAIHAHHGKHAVDVFPLAMQHNLPFIVSIRGSDGSAQSEALYNRNFSRYRSIVNHDSLFVPVCEYLGNELLKLGVPSSKINVLYGGIDLDVFPFQERRKPADGEFVIISVGRLVQKKGHDILIRAFKSVHETYPNIKLKIIGGGKERANLEALIGELHLTDAVFLLGKMSLFDIAEELKKAHLFCLPSEIAQNGDVEGIPNAIKEAMAIGLPVISTRHAGIPELISHLRTGYLIEERNVQQLSDGIESFLRSQETWSDYTHAARHVIEEQFDLKKQLIKQHEMYEKFLKRNWK